MENTLHMCAKYLTVACREEFEEHWDQTYHSLVLRGKLRTVVQCIMERKTGGLLQPGERCIETGEKGKEVLRTKHLEACPPTADRLDLYSDRPKELVPVDITNNTVMSVAGRLSGGAGPGGTGYVSLQHWLVRFRAASG